VWLAVAALLIAVLAVRTRSISSTQVIVFCVLVPSLVLHEVAHGAIALVFGDDTAKRAGRLTLNPLRHVDLLGTIIVPAITVWAGQGYFGWAKPVPVNVSRLRHPRNDGLLVSLAGPATNIVLSVGFCVWFHAALTAAPYGQITLGQRILLFAGVLNLWIAAFNLLPIPPLDGSALLERLLPQRWWPAYLRVRPMGMLLLLGAVVILSSSRLSPLGWLFTHVATWWWQLARRL
jgi:Zn-dependent protease